MKKTNIAKHIVSIVLAMSIVLSFALVSVSAIPGDYTVVDEKYEFIDFEDNVNTMISTSGGTGGTKTKIEDGSVTHSGDHSTMITSASNGHLKIWYTPFKNTSYAGWEANSTYYMSFWFYSDTWTGDTTIWGDDGYTYTASFSAKTTGQWNKAMLKITTGASPAAMGFPIGAYSLGVGNTIYFDDFEVAKVNGFTAKTNTVPAGATVVKSATKDFDTDASTGIGVAMGVASGSATKIGVTAAAAHYGERSYAIKGNDGNTGNVEFYFHPRLLMSSVDFTTTDGNGAKTDNFYSGTYYFSYYVCSPDAQVTTSAVSTLGSLVAPATIPQGNGWTKVSGTFNVSEENNDKLNSAIMNIAVNGIGSNTVYFDDFLLAEITDIQNIALAKEDVKYDFTNKIATVTIGSNIELKTAEVKLNDVAVTSTINADGKIVAEVPAETLEETYSLTVSTRDAFDRVNDTTVTFETPSASEAPMEFASASIKDSATGVVAPVDAIYFTTPYPVNETTLTTDKFSITGFGASVTGVALVDATKVKVSLAGIYPAETYVLSVSGVENTSGGVLTDRITFTTKEESVYSVNFDDIEVDEETGKKPVPGYFASAHSTLKREVSDEEANSETQSLKLISNTTDLYGGYAGVWINGMPSGKTYKVSFNFYSETWNSATNGGYMKDFVSAEYGTTSGIVFSSNDKAQWNKVSFVYTPAAGYGGALMQFRGVGGVLGESCVYIDDVSVQEVGGTICNPVMTKDGAYVYGIEAGDTTIEVPVIGGVSNVKAFAVQYGENNKMLTATVGTVNAAGNIEFALKNAQAVKTKIIIMDATTHAPLGAYIQYN